MSCLYFRNILFFSFSELDSVIITTIYLILIFALGIEAIIIILSYLGIHI
jgi:hypothetical protein